MIRITWRSLKQQPNSTAVGTTGITLKQKEFLFRAVEKYANVETAQHDQPIRDDREGDVVTEFS